MLVYGIYVSEYSMERSWVVGLEVRIEMVLMSDCLVYKFWGWDDIWCIINRYNVLNIYRYLGIYNFSNCKI